LRSNFKVIFFRFFVTLLDLTKFKIWIIIFYDLSKKEEEEDYDEEGRRVMGSTEKVTPPGL